MVKLGAMLSSFSFIPTDMFGLNSFNDQDGFQTEDIYHFKLRVGLNVLV